jgi:hypothetical protein
MSGFRAASRFFGFTSSPFMERCHTPSRGEPTRSVSLYLWRTTRPDALDGVEEHAAAGTLRYRYCTGSSGCDPAHRGSRKAVPHACCLTGARWTRFCRIAGESDGDAHMSRKRDGRLGHNFMLARIGFGFLWAHSEVDAPSAGARLQMGARRMTVLMTQRA